MFGKLLFGAAALGAIAGGVWWLGRSKAQAATLPRRLTTPQGGLYQLPGQRDLIQGAGGFAGIVY